MKRLTALAVTAAVALSLAGSALPGNPDGFKTAKPAYLVPMVPGAVVDPIISTGDVIVIEKGTQHWFKAVDGRIEYFVVKVR